MREYKVLIWGDSIAASTPDPWPAMCARTFAVALNTGTDNVVFTNIAVCGMPARQGKAFFAEKVCPEKPSLVILQFGFNDIRWDGSNPGGPISDETVFYESVCEMIRNSKNIRADVLVLGNHRPCSYLRMPDGRTYVETVAAYNALAKQAAHDCGADWLDMADLVGAELTPRESTVDGVHLSLWGKRVYSHTVANYIQRKLGRF